MVLLGKEVPAYVKVPAVPITRENLLHGYRDYCSATSPKQGRGRQVITELKYPRSRECLQDEASRFCKDVMKSLPRASRHAPRR
jgi:hypothetical protein